MEDALHGDLLKPCSVKGNKRDIWLFIRRGLTETVGFTRIEILDPHVRIEQVRLNCPIDLARTCESQPTLHIRSGEILIDCLDRPIVQFPIS